MTNIPGSEYTVLQDAIDDLKEENRSLKGLVRQLQFIIDLRTPSSPEKELFYTLEKNNLMDVWNSLKDM